MVSGGGMVDALAFCERLERVVGQFRFDAEDANSRPDRFGDRGAAGEKSAAADADHQRVESGMLFQQFERRSSLPRDNQRMVERRDQRPFGFFENARARWLRGRRESGCK